MSTKSVFFKTPILSYKKVNPCCLERRMPPSRFVHFGDVVKFYPFSIILHCRIKMPTCRELREKLASLGLATSGTKAVLEARLHAANVAVQSNANNLIVGEKGIAAHPNSNAWADAMIQAAKPFTH